jgi:hypothetical protein
MAFSGTPYLIKRLRKISAHCLMAAVSLILCGIVGAEPHPPVPENYRRFFSKYSDNRRFPATILQRLGLSPQETRSFALVAGVSKYPLLPEKDLAPANVDINNLARFFSDEEYFDEVVVVRDGDMTYDNIAYFLQSYFPDRLRKNPRSRFVFAYSGHGMFDKETEQGFLLGSNAVALNDRVHGLDMAVVKTLLSGPLRTGHHILALINACHSGAFVARTPFGGDPEAHIPEKPGAHVILCGGTHEKGYQIPEVGKGSVFFEKFLAGVRGHADIYPKSGGDGLITVNELATYITQEVRFSTDRDSNPISFDISRHGSLGSLYFLDKERFNKVHATPSLATGPRTSFGSPEETPEARLQRTLRSLFISPDDSSKSIKELRSQLVIAQEKLATIGAYTGEVDGLPGPKTTAAVKEWQRNNKVTATGLLDSKTLVSLREMQQVKLTNKLGMKFVPVPGTRVMFSVYETRVSDYAMFCKETGTSHVSASFQQTASHPVVNVSWVQAKRFCEWLSKMEGRKYRLPRDDEWSRAVGINEETGRTPMEKSNGASNEYPWGPIFPPSPKLANTLAADDGYTATAPVGSFLPNKLGLHDMSGNVWEWCEDKFDSNSSADVRVMRGGGWGDASPNNLASGFRWRSDAENEESESVGFRVVVEQ